MELGADPCTALKLMEAMQSGNMLGGKGAPPALPAPEKETGDNKDTSEKDKDKPDKEKTEKPKRVPKRKKAASRPQTHRGLWRVKFVVVAYLVEPSLCGFSGACFLLCMVDGLYDIMPLTPWETKKTTLRMPGH